MDYSSPQFMIAAAVLIIGSYSSFLIYWLVLQGISFRRNLNEIRKATTPEELIVQLFRHVSTERSDFYLMTY
ncbi:unnamed protein product [Auanema sp. JU1783]|nr:unnamed protein product [Auanema sp. JU1783]